MTQGERVKEVRKSLNLTLEKFGKKLGVGKTAISKIENGENNLTEQMQKAICREFNVDYIWLTTGEGEMFHPVEESVNDIMERIMKGENKMHIELLKWVATLDDEDIAHIQKMIDSFSDFANKENNKQKDSEE